MFEHSAWTQGEHGNFSAHQIYNALLSTWGEKPCVGFWSALCPWCQRGRVTWCLNRGRISLCLMYLSVVIVIKHHRGCHQVQRGRLLAIWFRMLSLMECETSSEVCADVYAGLYAWKRVWKLGFTEVCGMKCLICSVVLLLSVNDDLGCSNIDYAVMDQDVGLMNVPWA